MNLFCCNYQFLIATAFLIKEHLIIDIDEINLHTDFVLAKYEWKFVAASAAETKRGFPVACRNGSFHVA